MVIVPEAEETKAYRQPKYRGTEVVECTLTTNRYLTEFHMRDPAGNRDRVQMEIRRRDGIVKL